MTDIPAIRKMLEGVTEGPWEAVDFTVQPQHDHHSMKVRPVQHGPYGSMGPKDARFIAASPALVRRLCDEVERLTKENAALYAWNKNCELMGYVHPDEALKARIAELEAKECA